VARPSSAWDRLLELRTERWCKLAPDEAGHVKTMDLGGYLKKELNGDRVVVFMPTTVAAAEKVDIKVP
jgi:hypothetical protein